MSERKKHIINDLFQVQNGYAFKSKDLLPEPCDNCFEVLKMGHIEKGGGLRKNPKKSYTQKSQKLKKYILNKNDIVMAMTDMKDNVVILGVSAIIKESQRYLQNQRVARLIHTGTEISDVNFLYYYLQGEDFIAELQSKANSGVQVNLSTKAIKESPILLPPLPEQKAIAGVLSSLDDKIDLLHQQNKTLETMAETLFRQWFIEEAEDDWEEAPLSSIAVFLNGIACQKYPPKNANDKLPVLKIKDLRNGISNDCDYASTDIDYKYIIKKGDIIFSWSASLMVKIWYGGECILNQHLFKVTSNTFPKWFIYQWCKQHMNEFISISSSHATTMGHIRRRDLDEALVIIPPDKQLELMTKIIEPLMDKLRTNAEQLETLTSQRDILLPKLMSGDIVVESSERRENE